MLTVRLIEFVSCLHYLSTKSTKYVDIVSNSGSTNLLFDVLVNGKHDVLLCTAAIAITSGRAVDTSDVIVISQTAIV